MKKLLVFLLAVVMGFGLVACGNDKTPDPVTPETPTPSAPAVTIEGREDAREAVYDVCDAEGEVIESFASLYQAINNCVDEGDTGYYVAKDGVKMFINNDQYAVESADMFWFYEDGTSADAYSPWVSTYWADAKESGSISVYKNSGTGLLEPYANSWNCIAANPTPAGQFPSGSTAVWNTCWHLEASATVDMIAFSGITKSEYVIDLTEAEITPSYKGTDQAWPYVGFITADSYNTSNHGLRCDTTNGNWYYYIGETAYNSNSIEVDTDKAILTSTWDEANGCWRPNQDVTLTMELLTLLDEDECEYIVHRLTVKLEDGTTHEFDYEYSGLSQCGSIRFTSGLDIVSDNGLVDYMCGAKFENLTVTKATGTVLEDMLDGILYGTSLVLKEAGEYDLLNSNPMTAARFHTIVYNTACVEADFETAGKDVYSYSFDLDNSADALSHDVKELVDAIEAIETDADAAAAKELAKGLNDYQLHLVYNKAKLEEYVGSVGSKLSALPAQGVTDIKVSEQDGIYYIEFATLSAWCGIELFYEGAELTKDNVTLGDRVGTSYSAEAFYWDIVPDTENYCWFLHNLKPVGSVYTLVYNPTTNTLSATYPAE